MLFMLLQGGGMEIFMKGLYKKSAALLGYHALYSVVSLVFLLPFSNFIYYNDGVVKPLGGIVYTLVILLFYLSNLYSNIWHLGRAHSRKTSEIKSNPIYALEISLISEIPTYIIFVLMIIFHLKNPNSFNIFYTIFKFWQGIYIGVLDISKIFYVISLVLPIIFSLLGYIAGTKNFEFADKYIYPLIFKNKNKNKS